MNYDVSPYTVHSIVFLFYPENRCQYDKSYLTSFIPFTPPQFLQLSYTIQLDSGTFLHLVTINRAPYQ